MAGRARTRGALASERLERGADEGDELWARRERPELCRDRLCLGCLDPGLEVAKVDLRERKNPSPRA